MGPIRKTPSEHANMNLKGKSLDDVLLSYRSQQVSESSREAHDFNGGEEEKFNEEEEEKENRYGDE